MCVMVYWDNFIFDGNILVMINVLDSILIIEELVVVKVLKIFCYCVIMLMFLVGNILVIIIIY